VVIPPAPPVFQGGATRADTWNKLNRTFHEKAALERLGRDDIAIVWKLLREAAEAYQAGYRHRAQILIETADADDRLLRHAASERVHS
jgi:hypothetical protein